VVPDRETKPQAKPAPQKKLDSTAIAAELDRQAQSETGVKKAHTILLGND
jgi:hypothetical protein